jgi:Protein of unknown function (DUF3631)
MNIQKETAHSVTNAHSCSARCGGSDEVTFVQEALGITDEGEATRKYAELAGVTSSAKVSKPVSAPKQAAATEAKPAAPPVKPRPLGELLDAVERFLRNWVVFPLPEQVSVIAAWIVHTWVFEAFDYTPYLFVFSAAKRSGKSRVLEVIEQLAKNPRLTPGASSAALMRSVDESNPPTMLLDEVDTIYGSKGAQQPGTEAENTRRFLNAGYRRGAKFLRCVGQGADINVKELPAFCPKALAGIDRCLPDTVLDRSLPIELVRQSRAEKAERFREREVRAIIAPVRAELEAWAQQQGVKDTLRDARPVLPEELNDRIMDITEPLIAIGDLAGGGWPERIRRALVKLCSTEEDADISVKLLGDMKVIFDSRGTEKITTEEILEDLVAIEDRPWAFMFDEALKHNNLRIAAAKLAARLKGYKTPNGEPIKSRTIKLSDGGTAKGYHRSDFLEAWSRYLPLPQTNVTNVTIVTHDGKKGDVESNVTGQVNVTDLPREVTTVTAPQRQEQKKLWQTVLAKIPANGFLRVLSELVRPIGTEGRNFLLGHSPDEKSRIEALASASNRRQLEALLCEASGRDWSVKFVPKDGIALNDVTDIHAGKLAESLSRDGRYWR